MHVSEINFNEKALALALMVFGHKYFVSGGPGHEGEPVLTGKYSPTAWAVADYFNPDNDNTDVVWQVMDRLFDNPNSELGNAIMDSYISMVTDIYEILKEGYPCEINYRARWASIGGDSCLGNLTDDSIARLEIKRLAICRNMIGAE